MYHVPPFRCHIISFTFQSGYIQIKSLPAVVIIVSIFTFQSGYIQINIFWLNPRVYHHSLHSNMVIFKFRKVSVNVLSSVFFTFQYGYIQIFISLNLQIHITALYIPIWLYSNNANKGLMHIFVFFTFQPGYIQMINVSVCRS